MIIITSKQNGFRRCGIAHPSQPTTYHDDKFSDTEIEALQGEPMLSVTIKKDDPDRQKAQEEAAKKAAAAKKSAAAKKAAATKKANAKKAADAKKAEENKKDAAQNDDAKTPPAGDK